MLLPSMSRNASLRMHNRSLSIRRALILSISVALAAGAAATNLRAFAADDSSTMDSIWVDQSVRDAAGKAPATAAAMPSSSSGAETTPSAPAENVGAVAAGSPGTTLDTAAPMCTVGAFKDSPLNTGNGWAGLGPFKASGADNSEYVDDKQNRVRLDLSGDQITRAELTIANYKPARDPYVNLLNLQMNIDFLMESLGIKAGRIQNLNVQLERQKDNLLSGVGPLNITTGRYAIMIDRHPTATNGIDYVVSVNSMDVNKKLIKQPWISSEKPKVTSNPDIRVSMAPAEQPPKPKATPVEKTQLKGQFTDLIANWQKIKKEAVRTRQSEQLANVLAGKALVRQTDAVKWLVTNHRYYDMTPRGVTVDQYTEIVPSKKYMVAAQVHEAYKFIDEQTGKVLKEVDDVNKVNYTIERVGDKWVISDSNLLSASNTHGSKPH